MSSFKRTIITRAEQSYGRVTVCGTLPFVHFRICSRCRTAGCQGISFSSSSWVGDLPRYRNLRLPCKQCVVCFPIFYCKFCYACAFFCCRNLWLRLCVVSHMSHIFGCYHTGGDYCRQAQDLKNGHSARRKRMKIVVDNVTKTFGNTNVIEDISFSSPQR